MKDLLLFPFNGNAREAIDIICRINEKEPSFNLLGFVDDDDEKVGHQYQGVSVLGGREIFDQYPQALVLAVPGRPENFHNRDLLIRGLNIDVSRFATVIDPSAVLGGGVQVGDNSLIYPGVVITAQAKIGAHTIILANTVISHDAVIGDYAIIGSTVSVSGGVSIGEKCYLGSGSKIIQDVVIQPGCLIGLGAIILESIDSNKVVIGNPGRVIREVAV